MTAHGREDDFDLDGDTLREECGVFGIYGHPDAAALTALGLHALQHRGQEAAGIVAFDGDRFNAERRLGLVGDHFSNETTIKRLSATGKLAEHRVLHFATHGLEVGELKHLAEPAQADLLVAVCELILEGLHAQKKISRSEERGYTAIKSEPRGYGYESFSRSRKIN